RMQHVFVFPMARGTEVDVRTMINVHHAVEMPGVPDFAPGIELPAYIYCCGYFISFAALVLALSCVFMFQRLKMPTKYHSCEFISHLHTVGIIMDFNTIFTSDDRSCQSC
ncbi:hypothetical protein DOY81_015400, partial [Sarcophaga bullata]